MPDLEVCEDRRPIAQLAYIAYVRGRLVPEDELLVLAESADAVVDLARRDGDTAPRRSLEYAKPVDLLPHEDVALVLDVLEVAICGIVRIFLQIGDEVADVRDPLERVEQRLVPVLRRFDHVVVDLDDVRSRRQLDSARVGVRPDVLVVVDDRDSLVVERREVLRGPVVRGVVPDHNLLRHRRRSQQDVIDTALQQVQTIVRENDDGDHVTVTLASAPGGSALAHRPKSANDTSWSSSRSIAARTRGSQSERTSSARSCRYHALSPSG